MTACPEDRSGDRSRRIWIFVALGAGAFMSTMGASAVNAVLPVIRETFGASVATIEWVVAIFLLVVSALLLTFGRLGDLRGHRPIYLLGFTIFLAGSLLCGFAGGPGRLIAARAVQALGAAMLFANSPGILTKAFPPEARGRVLGLLSTMTYLGLTAGPTLGGWMTERWSWRWVFFINIPAGLLALALGARYIPRESPPEAERRFDFGGAMAFMAGLTALLLGLNQAHAWGWPSAPTILTLLGGVLILALFIWIERRVEGPMLDLSLFRVRIFSTATASAGLNYVSIYTCLFLMPFYLIQARGLSPAQAGALLTVQPLVMAVVAPISGSLSDRIGSRLPSTLGMSILSVGDGPARAVGGCEFVPGDRDRARDRGTWYGDLHLAELERTPGSGAAQPAGDRGWDPRHGAQLGMVLGVGSPERSSRPCWRAGPTLRRPARRVHRRGRGGGSRRRDFGGDGASAYRTGRRRSGGAPLGERAVAASRRRGPCRRFVPCRINRCARTVHTSLGKSAMRSRSILTGSLSAVSPSLAGRSARRACRRRPRPTCRTHCRESRWPSSCRPRGG